MFRRDNVSLDDVDGFPRRQVKEPIQSDPDDIFTPSDKSIKSFQDALMRKRRDEEARLQASAQNEIKKRKQYPNVPINAATIDIIESIVRSEVSKRVGQPHTQNPNQSAIQNKTQATSHRRLVLMGCIMFCFLCAISLLIYIESLGEAVHLGDSIEELRHKYKALKDRLDEDEEGEGEDSEGEGETNNLSAFDTGWWSSKDEEIHERGNGMITRDVNDATSSISRPTNDNDDDTPPNNANKKRRLGYIQEVSMLKGRRANVDGSMFAPKNMRSMAFSLGRYKSEGARRSKKPRYKDSLLVLGNDSDTAVNRERSSLDASATPGNEEVDLLSDDYSTSQGFGAASKRSKQQSAMRSSGGLITWGDICCVDSLSVSSCGSRANGIEWSVVMDEETRELCLRTRHDDNRGRLKCVFYYSL